MKQNDFNPNDIAIIGVGATMPGALSAPDFWNNICNGVNAITDVPPERWDASLYFSEDRDEPDKTYSKIGGWVTGYTFDRKLFRMPPTVVEQTDITQLATLTTVREALEDAGYLEKDFDRDDCAVILGNAMGGDQRDHTSLRVQYARADRAIRKKFPAATYEEIEEIKRYALEKCYPICEDSMPGELSNVISGRVAQVFNLRGPNFTADAACASTLAALQAAIDGLRARRYRLCIAGGADMTMSPATFVKFAKIGALSPDGSRPFDAHANGFVMGEGVGIVILKRLKDAIADEDKIYAIIKEIGAASDGRGKGITAPNPVGQKLAVERAYKNAHIAPNTVGLIEAHGTSTPVGDPVEFNAIKEVFAKDDTKPGQIAFGSVKSMIGHLKSAAAAASLVKVAFALKEKTLPPTINLQELNPKIELAGTPFAPQTIAQPWERGAYPRRAGISAFGFGGTNFHLVLEEYNPNHNEIRLTDSPITETTNTVFEDTKREDSSMDTSHQGNQTSHRMSIPEHEGIIGFYAQSLDEIRRKFTQFQSDFARDEATLKDYLIEFKDKNIPDSPVRLAIVFNSLEELKERVEKTARALENNKGWKVLTNQGIFLCEAPEKGKVAMLFPGQGSQYLQMGEDLRVRFDVVEKTFKDADDIMRPILHKELTDLIFPPEGTDEMEAFIALSQTEVTQPAVLALDVAILNLLKSLGIHPDVVAGHSLGEYGACVAAEVMTFEEALRTVAARGTEMAHATPMNGDCGLMAAVNASVDDVRPILDSIEGYVVCANINCPTQTIIAGLTDAVEEAIEKFKERGLNPMLLPVSHAFHSKVVASASVPLRKHLSTIDIKLPSTPILTNVTGDFYPSSGDPDAIRDLLAEQVAAPVEYIKLINRMYENGARIFVEVGPKRAQTAFVSSILAEKEHSAFHTNHPKKGQLHHFYNALAGLWIRCAWQKNASTTPLCSTPTLDRNDVLRTMVGVLCEKTGYDPDEIDTSYELEADLGVDTVKQAEIMAEIRSLYDLPRDENFKFSEHQTLDSLADYVLKHTSGALTEIAVTTNTEETPVKPTTSTELPTTQAALDRNDILQSMVAVLCEKTGYDPDEIDTSYELEADLGVDTVKQAEIMAEIRSLYDLPRDENFKFSEHQTLDSLADYVLRRVGEDNPAAIPVSVSVVSEEKHVISTSSEPTTHTKPALSRNDVLRMMVALLCEKTGYDPDEIDTSYELEADLGIDTVKQAEIMAEIRSHYDLPRDENFKFSEHQTLDSLADYVLRHVGHESSAPKSPKPPTPTSTIVAAPKAAQKITQRETFTSTQTTQTTQNRHQDNGETSSDKAGPEVDAVISGTSIGLPGLAEMFAENAIDELIAGTNMITPLTKTLMQKMVDKNIVRLVKKATGGGEMEKVENIAEVIKLGGQRKHFNLKEFGVDERLIQALDLTSQYAIAAGLLALRSARLPLVPKYQTTRTGDKITRGWGLPQEIGDRTGVIFASAFAGQDALIEELEKSHGPEYTFNHRFLLIVLGIANSRFAEYLGLRGPNTKINNACASTTTAIGIARDWIRLGHCDRVVILSADDASAEDSLMEWVASGFLATGAASTKANVEEAALPFDNRRNGMIIGMGAVSLVVEKPGLSEERGVEPLTDILDTHFVNSGFHPTRLDVDHIASQVGMMISRVEKRFNLSRDEMAKKMVFVSHETYTPRRGGSAAAEIESIRRTFGASADQVVIANTKGFTGHAMGAGLEDVLAIRALQKQELPPIANFKEPDPDLGNLHLSKGGKYKLDYALRLAAGFGSQLALVLYRKRATFSNRLTDTHKFREWLVEHTEFSNPETFVDHRVLKVRQGEKREEITEKHVVSPKENPDFTPRAIISKSYRSIDTDATELLNLYSGKTFGIIGGPHDAAQMIQTALTQCEAKAIHFRVKGTQNGFTSKSVFIDFDSQEAIEQALHENPTDGVINLLGFAAESIDEHLIYQAAKRTFIFAKAWYHSLKRSGSEGKYFVSLTNMGGRLGFSLVNEAAPTAGGVAGLTKALAHEWPQHTVKTIDIPTNGLYPRLGLRILKQIVTDQRIELGISGQDCFEAVSAPIETICTHKNIAPVKEDLLLVTGGAKGITAEIVKEVAKCYQCKIALIGRTSITYADPLAVDIEEERERLKKVLSEKGERITPLMLRNALKPLLSQREIVQTMRDIDALGSPVAYFTCDMADKESVKKMIEAVSQQFGQINGVIHGAGVEESKQIEDKDLQGFNSVFKGKALGATYLWQLIDNPLKFFITFGSVAGRFGNPGQTDYSAANEVMNKLVATINETSSTPAIAIDWTAWDEVGMAAESAMRMILVERGIDLLPPKEGKKIFCQLLESGAKGEVLIAGKLGDFIQNHHEEGEEPHHAPSSTPNSPKISDIPSTTTADVGNYPFTSQVIEKTDDSVTIEAILDLEKDYFLRDHRYEGNAVFPGVMGYQMMAEAAHLLGLNRDHLTAYNVAFMHALKLHRDEPITVRATATRMEGGKRASLLLTSSRETKSGRVVRTEHFSAEFGEEEGSEAGKSIIGERIQPQAAWKEGITRAQLYRHYFHTGVFQVVEQIIGYSDSSVVGIGVLPVQEFSRTHRNSDFFTDPMVRELAFQVAGYWGMVVNKRSYLPLAIEKSEMFAHAQPAMPLIARAAKRDDAQEGAIAFDIEVYDEKGQLLQRLTKCELIAHRTLSPEETLDEGAPLTFTDYTMSAPEAYAYLADRNIIFDDILFQKERHAYDRLLSNRRRSEWVAARVCTKVLIQRYLLAFCGEPSKLTEIEIAKHDSGAPYIRLHGNYPDLSLPNLSITHSDGLAIAALAGPGPNARIGIDLETVERRDPAFANNYFLKSELALFDNLNKTSKLALGTFVSMLWSIKEAVSKALGVGLSLNLDDVVIESIRPAEAATPQGDHSKRFEVDIELKGGAKEIFTQLGGRALSTIIQTLGRFVFSQVHLNLDQAYNYIDIVSRTDNEFPQSTTTNLDERYKIAAAAALFRHKGLITSKNPALEADSSSSIPNVDIPSWKS